MNPQLRSSLVKTPPISNWNTITYENPCTITTEYEIYTIDISPDGRHIASGHRDGTIQIWDPITGSQYGQTLKSDGECIYAIKYSKCGKYIISGGSYSIRQWSTQNFELVKEPIIARAIRVEYSLHQQYIISCSDDAALRFWNAQTGVEQVHKRITHTSGIYRMCLSGYLTQLAFGDRNGNIVIWDYKSDKLYRKFSRNIGMITSLEYSNDSKKIVSCSSLDLVIIVRDIQSGTLICNLLGHTRTIIHSAKFSSDMLQIISGGDDSTTRIWDIQEAEELYHSQPDLTQEVMSAQFSLDGKYIIIAAFNKEIKIIKAPESN